MTAAAEKKPRAEFPVDKFVKLLEAAKEKHTQIGALLDEVDALLGGKAGVGSEMKQLETAYDAFWCERYAPGSHGQYVWNHKRDKPQMKRLIKLLGIAEVIERASRFLGNDENFYLRTRHNFGVFVQSINSHAGESKGSRVDPVPGCMHVPACTSDQQHTKRRNQDMRA